MPANLVGVRKFVIADLVSGPCFIRIEMEKKTYFLEGYIVYVAGKFNFSLGFFSVLVRIKFWPRRVWEQ